MTGARERSGGWQSLGNWVPLVVVLASFGAVGCGGSDDEADTQPNQPTTEAATPAKKPADTSPTGQMRARLQAAGYEVAKGEFGSDKLKPDGTLDVVLGDGEVTIYLYSSPAEVAKAESPFGAVEQDQPDQIEVRSEGSNLYVGTIEEPAKLPLGKFNRVIAVAEGK